MLADILTAEARRENSLALQAALGINAEQATQALAITVLITVDASALTARLLAQESYELLSRTVRSVVFDSAPGEVDVEVVVGAALPRAGVRTVFVSIDQMGILIGSTTAHGSRSSDVPPILALFGACYVAAAALKRGIPALPYSLADPMAVSFDELGIDLSSLAKPIEIDHAFLAGAGAVGNGFLWAARHMDIRGELDIVDDDVVSSGNLNRQIWFQVDDIGKPKSLRLAERCQNSFPKLKLTPQVGRLQDVAQRSAGPWLKRLFVAVDSRRARRQLQNEFPREVFDTSTTDIREIVLHYNRQPTERACLSCVYEPDREEFTREQHIAESLGVPVEEVRGERISQSAALIIANRFAWLRFDQLEGTSYDTLFKRLCAESALEISGNRRVVAPFAFVSVLAGTVLALETVRRLARGSSDANFNYWRISAWHPPIGRRRIMRAKEIDCAFCSDVVLRDVNARLWGDH
jgi:hypothetical protein